MENYYDILKVKAGADAAEIKASFRRLAKMYHPDIAGNQGGDAWRFHKVHEAYKALLRERQENRPPVRDSGSIKSDPQPSARPLQPEWRFEGVRESGADLTYVLRVSLEAAREGLDIILPWKAEDACPRCLGEGHTLAPIFGGPHLARIHCPRCGGKGVVTRNSTVHVALSPDMMRQGTVRMKNLGHYNPARGTRGDLVVVIGVEGAWQRGRMYTA